MGTDCDGQSALLLARDNVNIEALEYFGRQVVSAWLKHCSAQIPVEDRAPSDLFLKLPLLCLDRELKKPAMSVFTFSEPPGKTQEAMRTEEYFTSSSHLG